MSNNNPVNPKIHIVVGTVTETALKVARALKATLHGAYDIRLYEYPDLDDIISASNQFIVFCVSNTGAGELPPRMRKLYVQLTEQTRDLSGHRYLIINLGDRSYKEYGLSGKILDIALRRAGAVRVHNRLTIDALIDNEPEITALNWLKPILDYHYRPEDNAPENNEP